MDRFSETFIWEEEIARLMELRTLIIVLMKYLERSLKGARKIRSTWKVLELKYRWINNMMEG